MRPLAQFFSACFFTTVTATTSAVEQLAISLGTIEGSGWSAEEVQIIADAMFGPAGDAILRIRSLELSESDIALSGVEIHCPAFELTESNVACRDGKLQVSDVLDMRLAGQINIDYAFSGDVSVVAGLDRFAGGRLSLTVSQTDGELVVQLDGGGLDSAALHNLAGKITAVPDYQLSGRIDVGLQYESTDGGDDVLRLDLSGSNVSFSNESGTQAGENIALDLRSEVTADSSGWHLNTHANLQQGLLYLDPIYLDTGEKGIMLHADGILLPGRDQFSLSKLVFNHKNVLKGSVRAHVRFLPSFAIGEYDATIDKVTFPVAYQTYLQPWLYGSMLGDLDTRGVVTGRVKGQGSQIQALNINLASVGLEDKRGRFSLAGLNGNASWANEDRLRPVDLSWEAGSLYRIALGATHLPLVVGRDSIALREPSRISILDGALEIDHWQLERPGQADMTWLFDGVLTPISLEDICAALDWPPFSGKLSGVIPEVRYKDALLTVGGVLLMRAFDGNLTVSDLSLEQPFGLVPRLSANLAISNLDLEQLTSAFSFGKIEGRLEGRVSDLTLVNWQPVAFDAAFANPDDDDARHRISQKAIDNLSNIGGGGVGNALSKTFLGAFEEFPYDRLGISCRLTQGVCHMDGVAPAPGGYYIVKGRFLPPRIDIVGYSDRVDWESLLARIKAAIGSGGATIQ